MGLFLPLFLSWDLWILNQKGSHDCGAAEGPNPFSRVPPGCVGITLSDLGASCIPGDRCESKVICLQPVPWGCVFEPSRDLKQKEISRLESGRIKAVEAPFSIPWRVTAYSRDIPRHKTAALF